MAHENLPEGTASSGEVPRAPVVQEASLLRKLPVTTSPMGSVPTNETVLLSPGKSVEAHLPFLTDQRNYLDHYISLADTKAVFVFGILSAILLSALHKSDWAGLLLNYRNLSLLDMATIGAFTSIMFGIGSAVNVVRPRFNSSCPKGLVSWSHISCFGNQDEYLRYLALRSTPQLADEVARHVFDLATINKAKFFWLTTSFYLGLGGTLLWAGAYAAKAFLH